MRFAWLSGVAAAAIVVAFLLPWGRQSEIRADTLLARAATSAVHNARPSRLRIRTRRTSFVRPAALRGAAASGRDEAAIEERFVAAHYDWQEPLSVQSYTDLAAQPETEDFQRHTRTGMSGLTARAAHRDYNHRGRAAGSLPKS